MAVVLSDFYKKSYKTSEKTNLVGVFETPDARTLTAEMKVMTLEATHAVAPGIADDVHLGRLPKGVRVRKVLFFSNVAAATIVGLYALGSDADLAADPAPAQAFPAQTPVSLIESDNTLAEVDFELPSDHNVGYTGNIGTQVKCVIYYTEM